MAKRIITLAFGITVMGFAVALAKTALIGTSPISSVPNVVSIITPLTIGEATVLFMLVIVFLEWVVLCHGFGWHNLIQILPSLLFGAIIDVFVSFLRPIHPQTYIAQLSLSLVSIPILAIGVYCEVNSNLLMMPGEGIASALAQRFHKKFGTMKILADSTMVVAAALLALVCTHRLIGVREGTILSALLTGECVSLVERGLPRFTNFLRR
ncbi:DUF6198 family protein [Bifidobacterium sp. ESL0732]|uniref:YczE/YyaS/YitT family protein n=1 Tax=Bifidobacterium sp. ESL0732 TaxID=2983222 RepID=UPI0023F748AA|nr:DUF6198 family protein [Bifidobacterium sp. ESL0732]WEV63668.1 DUF6198 family protein [Bifidobacterium sp. ESL0732]